MDTERAAELRRFYHDRLMQDIMPFWMASDLIDRRCGGFLTSVDREGRLYDEDKSVWFQGRCLWTFSRLCNTYGPREEWLEAAKSGAAFLRSHCIDPADGRMFFTVTRDGRPLRKRRYFFSESFLTAGFTEYYGVTGDPADLRLAADYFDRMLRMYRDPSADPFKITPKENTAVRRLHGNAEPMVLVSTAQALRRVDTARTAYYDGAIRSLIDDMLTLHDKPELGCMLENVLPDGSIFDGPAGRTINPGHSIENSWFLMNYANTVGDQELLRRALGILRGSLERGWDMAYGGIVYFTDVYGRPCVQLEHDMKLWWVHNEALIATLLAWVLTGDETWGKWYDRLHEYTFGHFPDAVCGEWYGYLHRDGTVSHTQKGSLWKGPYHLPRCLMLCEQILTAAENSAAIPPLL